MSCQAISGALSRGLVRFTSRMRDRRGFSMFELMIVVGIIGIIGMVALP
jgi:prepilin-type N-terminal cleavage/methylation domain-containing protein